MEFLRQARENALKNQPMTYMPSQASTPQESRMHRTPTTEMRKAPVRGAKKKVASKDEKTTEDRPSPKPKKQKETTKKSRMANAPKQEPSVAPQPGEMDVRALFGGLLSGMPIAPPSEMDAVGTPIDAIQQLLQQPSGQPQQPQQPQPQLPQQQLPQPVPDQTNPVAMLTNMLNQAQTQAAVQGQVMQDNIAALASTGVNITSPVGQKIANAVAQLDPATVSMISDMIAKSAGNSAEGEALWNDLLFVSGLA
jgi:hypothetical protein